jgi:hypothetical protein
MTINSEGIQTASRDELLAYWIIDNDLFRLFSFWEWLHRCKAQGVKVYG